MTLATDVERRIALGWDPQLDEQFEPFAADDLVPARVAVQHRGAYTLYTDGDDVRAQVTPRLRRAAASPADFPVVGDWVALRPEHDGTAPVIDAVLPRRSSVARKSAGLAAEEQVLAANVDVLFVVTSANRDFNLRRLERYLALAWESGAAPVIVLSKADLDEDVEERVAAAESIAFGVPVHAVSAVTGVGLDALGPYFHPHRTGALLGSSGVGKSTILNVLLGEERQAVQGTRGDDRGRHTTTNRELVLLPSGGLVLDTPGMRELGLWNASAGVDDAFEDVSSLAAGCRFSDCRHEREPGCAIRRALEEGTLDPARLESYRKLQRELRHLELKADPRAAAEARKERRRQARMLRS